MSKRVLCKFFAHGACLKGEHCEFSHNWTDPPNNVCTYYQKGICSYGSRCRYEHVKPSRSNSPRATSPVTLPQLQSSDSFYTLQPSGAILGRTATAPDASVLCPASSIPLLVPTEPVWSVDSVHDNFSDDGDALEDPRSVKPAERPICSFAAAGNCPRGQECPHIHGEQCPSCLNHCLHPFRPQEREEHIRSCEKKQQHLEALRRSQEIECSVCLDRVLSKPTAAERKFGLLSECDHPFCVSCIRNWRSTSPSSGMDLNNTLRSCPICRKLSYFVIPSVIWYFSPQEKQDIINNYKAKLRSIDCKHFNFGSGNCPFGTSCFYRHAYRDGRLEEVVLRHLGSEDGSTVIARNVRLSDFLSDLRIT